MAYIDYDDYCIYYGPGNTVHEGVLFPYPDPPFVTPYEIKYGPTSPVINTLYAKGIVPENYLIQIISFDDEHSYLGSWNTRGYSCYSASGNDPIDVPIFNAGLVPLNDTFVGGYEGSLSYSGNFGSWRQWKIGIQRIREISLPAGGYRVWQDLGAIYFVEVIVNGGLSDYVDVVGTCIPGDNAFMRFTVTIDNQATAGYMLPFSIASSYPEIVDDSSFSVYVAPSTITVSHYDIPILDISDVDIRFNITSAPISKTWHLTIPNCFDTPDCSREDMSCLQIYGPTEICQDGINHYTVRQNVSDYCLDDYNYGDKTIYLNYNQSNIAKDIDFTGPKSVYIKPGEDKVNFDVDIHTEYSEGKFLQIDIDEVN